MMKQSENKETYVKARTSKKKLETNRKKRRGKTKGFSKE